MPHLDDEIVSAFLTPERSVEIRDSLLHSSDQNDRTLGRLIGDSLLSYSGHNPDLPIQISAAAAPEPKELLDSAIRDATNGGRTIPPRTYLAHFQNVQNWGLALLQEVFVELRQKICGKGKKPVALGPNENSALAALGLGVCKLLGVSNALGVGIAVLVITNVAWIGKAALCKMTSPEELAKYFA